jgi:SHS2 domain-containing protein
MQGEPILKRGFKFHDHTADITIECWAPTLEEAFSEAALATFDVIVDTNTVKPVEATHIVVDGSDVNELLVEWIGHLIALVDIDYMFFSKFDVLSINKVEDGYSLEAKAYGEEIDHSRHVSKTEVKAMTYADLRIEKHPDHTRIWFTLDL